MLFSNSVESVKLISLKLITHYSQRRQGIDRSPANSPHKGQWRGALIISLICVSINVWVNNREAGDLGRHRAHYDVTVIMAHILSWMNHMSDNFLRYPYRNLVKWLDKISIWWRDIYLNLLWVHITLYPANLKRYKHVIITPKRHFDVIITCFWRFVFCWLARCHNVTTTKGGYCCDVYVIALASPGHSQMILFLPLLYSFVMRVATVCWKVPGYFTMIFHIRETILHDSIGYDITITIRFT